MDDELSPMDSGRDKEAVREKEPGSTIHKEIVATSPQEAVGREAGEAGECVTHGLAWQHNSDLRVGGTQSRNMIRNNCFSAQFH